MHRVAQTCIKYRRMISSVLILLASWAIFSAGGAAVSSVLKNGDVTLLYHNELDSVYSCTCFTTSQCQTDPRLSFYCCITFKRVVTAES